MPHLRNMHRLRNVRWNSLSPACRSGYDGIFERSLEGYSSSPALPFPVADHHASPVPNVEILPLPLLCLDGIGDITQRACVPGNHRLRPDVRPILVSACISCHGVARQEGNYRLDQSRWALGEGSDGKPNIFLFEAMKVD